MPTFTGCTNPPRIRRRLASPDAEMTSYWSGFLVNSWNASSDVPKTWTVVLQPVASSNGLTQLEAGWGEPASPQPGKASTDAAPSPVRIDASGVGPLEAPELPHAAAATMADA